jgi:hypothetical protein
LPQIFSIAVPMQWDSLTFTEIKMEEFFMKTARTLAIATLAMASLPLLAQQANSPNQQPGAPAAAPAQAQPPTAPPEAAPAPSPSAATAAATMNPVNGELVDKLDSKTAKTGDAVVIKTRSDVKTADGTAIPKGSRLVGHIIGVKPSGQGNDNSQVALQFDHAELKGGQNMPIHAELVGLSASDSEVASNTSPDAAPAASPSPSGSASPSARSSSGGSMNGSSSAAANPSPSQPQMSSGASPAASPSGANAGVPAAGTVVARTGNIAIRTTSIPGVLLANNEPGQQDPRMAQSSGILLGPKHDIHLEGGTRVVVGVAASGASAPGGN